MELTPGTAPSLTFARGLVSPAGSDVRLRRHSVSRTGGDTLQDLNAALRLQHGHARSTHDNYSSGVHSRHDEVSTPQSRSRSSTHGNFGSRCRDTHAGSGLDPGNSASAASVGERLDSLVHRLAAPSDGSAHANGSVSLPVPLPQPRSTVTRHAAPSGAAAAAGPESPRSRRRQGGARPPSRGSTDPSAHNDDINSIRPRVRAFDAPAAGSARAAHVPAAESPPSRGMGAMQKQRPASAASGAHKRGKPSQHGVQPPPSVDRGGGRRLAFSETAEVDGFTVAPVTYNIPIVVTNSSKHRRASSAVVRPPKAPSSRTGTQSSLPNEPRAIPGRREASAHVSRGAGGIMGGPHSARAAVGGGGRGLMAGSVAPQQSSSEASEAIVQQLLDVDAEMLQWEASLERQRAGDTSAVTAGGSSPQTGFSGLFMSSPLQDGAPSPATSMAPSESGGGGAKKYPPVSPITGASRSNYGGVRTRRATDGGAEFVVPGGAAPPLPMQAGVHQLGAGGFGDQSPTSAVWDMALQSGMERMRGGASALQAQMGFPGSQKPQGGAGGLDAGREASWGSALSEHEHAAVSKRPPLRSRSGTTRRAAHKGIGVSGPSRRRVQSAVTAHYRKPEGCRLGDDFLTLFAPVAETAEDEEGDEWGDGGSPDLQGQPAGAGSAGGSPDALALSGVIEDTTGGVLDGIDTSWGGGEADAAGGAGLGRRVAALHDEDEDDVVELVWDAAAEAQLEGVANQKAAANASLGAR